MSPDAQRIAIAQTCGWVAIRPSERYECSDDRYDQGRLIGTKGGYTGFIPDYIEDLDACAEMEKELDKQPKEIRTRYTNNLIDLVGFDGWYETVVRATAPQRCEAFLRTMNLWDDTK